MPLVFYGSHRQIPTLTGSKGKSLAVTKFESGLFDGYALGCCSRRRRILVQTAAIKVTASALDGIPTHETPRNIYSNAGGDFVSFAGEYPAILLQGRSCGLGAVVVWCVGNSVIVIAVGQQQKLVALFLCFHETARPATLPGIYCCFCDGRIHCCRWVLPFWESSNSNCVYCVWNACNILSIIRSVHIFSIIRSVRSYFFFGVTRWTLGSERIPLFWTRPAKCQRHYYQVSSQNSKTHASLM